jgi:altronate hydrolase
MVGLGCESNQIDFLLDIYGIERGALFRTMNIQHMGGLRRTVDAGIKIVEEMLPHANEIARQTCDASHLMLALQCGGSDAWSGVTANPALGYAADLLIRNGGTAVLAETPEIYGAEHLLTSRARDEATAEKLMQRIKWWENYTTMLGGSMDNNPSPGNKEGGLTTILEKSLGAVAKSGTQTLEGVYRYGEPIDRKGFVFMDSPGYDPVSITGEIASGCNIAAFTTGRGSVFGSKPAPCIKIATNSEMYHRMSDDMDINAGSIVDDGETIEDVGSRIFELLLEVASGKPSLSEAQGLGDYEFVPWQIGAVM